jgi:hypothetical protein
METVVMERTFNPPIDGKTFREMAAGLADCLVLYRAQWQESFLSEDGSSLTCCFHAPDSESVRMMARDDGSQYKRVWAGSEHDTARAGAANVVVERRFEDPVTVESLQAIEDAAAWCLELHKVTFLRTYFSADKKSMLCLYQAPDAESLRLAQHQAGMPVERIWACKQFTPENFTF